MKRAVFWTIIVAILLTPIAALEFYLRFIGLGDPIIYDADSVYGYAPRANQKKQRLGDAVVTVNESGLRSLDSWLNNEKQKILFLGDSVTWGGTGTDDTQVFPHLFCETANNRALKEKYVCGNAGVNGYGVLNMVLRAKYDERINDADVFIFVIYVGDFLRGLRNRRVAHYFLRENDVLLPAINELVNYIGFKYDINRLFAKKSDIEERHQFEAADFAIDILKDFSEDVVEKGKSYYVVLSPNGNDIDFKRPLAKHILSRLEEFSSDTILLSDPLSDKERTLSDNIHYTLDGHVAVAKYLSEAIALGATP